MQSIPTKQRRWFESEEAYASMLDGAAVGQILLQIGCLGRLVAQVWYQSCAPGFLGGD